MQKVRMWVIFSLGMGNPIGLLTLDIYSLWLFKPRWAKWVGFLFSTMAKLFPIVLLPLLVLRKKAKRMSLDIPNIKILTGVVTTYIVLSFILLPTNIWSQYRQTTSKVYNALADPTIYNQSFASTLARFGITLESFSPIYWVFASVVLLVVLIILWKLKNRNNDKMEGILKAFLNSSQFFANILLFLILIYEVAKEATISLARGTSGSSS